MLGFFRFRRSVKHVTIAIKQMIDASKFKYEFEGRNIDVPFIVYADAYIIGFLQSFTVYYSHIERQRDIQPSELHTIFVSALSNLMPISTEKISQMLIDINDTDHQFHVNYKIGKCDGEQYCNALMSENSEAAGLCVYNLSAFIKRNYLEPMIKSDA